MIVEGIEVRDIPGFPGYAVSAEGRVWSGRKQRWLKPAALFPSGHLHVNLGRGHTQYVHRRVLETFVGHSPTGMECRHLNGNPQDNRVENLAWGTRKENRWDSVQHGTSGRPGLPGEMNPKAKLTDQDARMIVYERRTGLFTLKELANIHGVSIAVVGKIVNKQAWKHIWSK